MAQLARSVASLRIFGDDLKPEEITQLLGCAPTHSWPKGYVQKGSAGREYVKKSGAWLLHATDSEPENLDGQVSELSNKLTRNLDIWSDLAKKYQVDLFCGWFMQTSNEGLSISIASMQILSERGIELSLDIYGPDEQSEKTATAA